MRCREWYGWHFPELGNIVQDHAAYVKTVHRLGKNTTRSLVVIMITIALYIVFQGRRTATIETDLSDILPADLEARVKEAATISMGTDISDEDMEGLNGLCDMVR